MMMSQNYAPYVPGYPTIDAARTDLNRLFYNEIRPEAVSNLPINPVWGSLPSYQQPFIGQGYPQAIAGQGYYQPTFGGYPTWQGYQWQGFGHPELSWETRYADPRYADPRYTDPRYFEGRHIDPRFVDPRLAMDPRFVVEPRYFDPRYSDYRWSYAHSSAHLYSSLAPALNVAETPDAHLLVVELPGVDVRDVSLQVAGNQLVLTAFRKPIWNNGTVTLGYHATEGRFGTLRRVFQVPAGYPTSQIQASFVNGQLTIVLPKSGVPMGATMPTANIAINAAIAAGV